MALVQFSGLASGIDSQSLIKAILTQQRTARINPLQNKITELQDTNSALKELKDLLNTLKTKADRFRVLSGGALAKFANSTDESVVTATASNSATPASYNLTATQLAKNGTTTLASLSQTYTSSSDAINSAIAVPSQVNVTVGLAAEAEVVTVDVDATTTLDQFVASYNSQATKSVASVINSGTSSAPSYQILISSSQQGEDQGTIQVAIDPEIATAGAGAFDNNGLSQATNATFTLDGVSGTITRSNNTVSDLINGVTFNLQGTGSSIVTIGTDKTASTSALKEFVEAYNAIVEYVKENDQVQVESSEDGNTNTFGSLAKINLDDSILSSLRQSFSSAANSSGAIRTLADLGITTNRDGTVSFDEDVFGNALESSSDGVSNLLANLGETLASVNGTIDQFTRFNGLIDITSNSQTDLIKKNTDRIGILESQLARQEQGLVARFSRLEAIIGKLQSQQSSLSGLLAGIG